MVGPIWPGLARDPFAQCCAPQKPDKQRGRDEDVPYGVRMSFQEWHNNRLGNVIGVPFRTQVCPPHVWLSLWMTWPRPMFDTTSLFVTYVYTNLILLLWTLGHMKQFRQQFQRSGADLAFFQGGGGGFDLSRFFFFCYFDVRFFLLFWTPVSDVFLASTNAMETIKSSPW